MLKDFDEIAVLSSSKFIKQKEYWVNKLSEDFEPTSLPFELEPQTGASKEHGRIEILIPQPLCRALMKLSKGSDLSIYIVLLATLKLLIYRHTNSEDVVIISPMYKANVTEETIANNPLLIQGKIHDNMTFKELILDIRESLLGAYENQDYPFDKLMDYFSNLDLNRGQNFQAISTIVCSFSNIHVELTREAVEGKLVFAFSREENRVKGTILYEADSYETYYLERFSRHFASMLESALQSVEQTIFEIPFLSSEEKRQLILDFNKTEVDYPKDKTIHMLFEEQAQRTPRKIAVYSPIVLNNIFTTDSCFKKSPYIFETDLELSYHPDNNRGKLNFKLLKTHCHNSMIINRNMLKLIDLFDGESSTRSIFSRISDPGDIKLVMYPVEINDLLEITHNFNHQASVFSTSKMSFGDFISLVQFFYNNHFVELEAVKSHQTKTEKLIPEDFDPDGVFDSRIVLKDLLMPDKKLSTLSSADVLLLGDTPGMPSTGLLYMAAYLKRNGMKACCRFYDTTEDFQSMKQDIEKLLEKIRPKIVAISMKWFPYIARVLDICRIVKDYSEKTAAPIKIVVGGNTAAYYWDHIIKYEFIDYVIRGDGELPLLSICRGDNEADVPNCVYKKDGAIIENPVTYIKDDTNSPDIYLSHLDEIMFPEKTSLFSTFFIYTHLGCGMNCLYCGGNNQAQQKTFNRKTVFIRPVQEVRKDIMAAHPYTSTFQFDFDILHKDLVEYCRKIWEGIDLSGHFCLLNSLQPPSASLVELAAKTFKYVYWDLDVLTLSERHRKQLFSLGVVKPQPTNQEILAILERCDAYGNVEVRLNLINGLPGLLPEDIEGSEIFLPIVMSGYRSFNGLHWARLHAQPGAPILENAETYDMHSFATTFEDFMEYSKNNFSSQSPGRQHSRLEHLNYPYVYFNDDSLNSKITLHYSETNKKIQQYQERGRTSRIPGEAFTYEQLDRKANQLARLLRARGVGSDSIVGIMLNPSIEIPLAILAGLKAGGGYLPIAPPIPAGRISTMVEDSRISVLISRNNIIEENSFTGLNVFQVSQVDPYITHSRPQITDLDDLPIPDRSLVDHVKYHRYIGQALVKNCIALQATRGCPYKCAYCHKIWPKTHVFRSAENIFAEVQSYYRMGVRRFAFIDDIFNLNMKNSRRFFELIIKNRLDIQLFFPNGMRGDLLTTDYIDLMVKAGTVGVALALETASPGLQRLLGKNINLEKLRKNLEYFCEKYPHVILELFTMHGFPTETKEEAQMTLDFIKNLKWVHFPYVAILQIFPNTDMARIALENGISAQAIARSEDLAFHELPETLPFDKSVTLKYQANFLNEYFLSKERLRHVLPHQLKVLTKDEMVQKYNSYLPVDIETFDDLLRFIGITEEELGIKKFVHKDFMKVPHLNRKLREFSPPGKPSPNALKVLLLDLSQYFSSEGSMLYDVVEPPLGLMYLMTYLKQQWGAKIEGKIAKSRIDFDNLVQLKTLLETFKPGIIGIRTLSFYKKFFHEIVAWIRKWGIDVPIIAGGPYATSGYVTLLQDRNVDLVVLGEGEVTFSELIGKIMANGGRLPQQEELKEIASIAFIPETEAQTSTAGITTTRSLVLLDDLDEPLTEISPESLAPISLPFHNVYTIYTSGTTGKPKGVALTHENLVNYVYWVTQEGRITAQDNTMLTSSFAFDLGYTSLYPSLLAGGECHILPRDIYMSPERLLDYIDQKGITYIKVTPSLFKTIVNSPGFSSKKCRTLRLAFIGGEAINLEDLETTHSICPHMKIINHYGPTEATIGCVAISIDFDRFDEYKKHPVIGKAIFNTNVYILGKDLKMLPIGVPGELCISGTCLARGYLNHPELTAEKFDQDFQDYQDDQDEERKKENYLNKSFLGGPGGRFFKKVPLAAGGRIYKTGDLARWMPDGNVEFLGRIDNQIKIRGYRVELEEIKNQLLRHNKIKEALVTVIDREDARGGKSLCAYIVLRKEEIEIEKNKKILSLKEIEEKEKLAEPVKGDSEPVSIVRCFEGQVKKFHDKIAIESNGKTWTFDALNRYANQVAHTVLENYDDRYMLSKKEKVRYKRQIILAGWGVESQEKLKSTTVFVAGAGGGASPTIMQLALTGFGTIKICDYDVVELSNLNRQFLHDESRIGMNKALSAKETINRINPHVNVIPITEKLTEDNVFEWVGDAAIIFDMLDDPADKFILSECAVVKQVPHIIISMADINAYTAIFHTPKTPCYHCIFSKKQLEVITAGMKSYVENYSKNPLAVAATSLFISTGVAVNEALKILLGFEKPAYNKLFYFNQGGASRDLVNSNSYRSMTHLFSEHFRKMCREQGFDWEIGWRGHFLEELDIEPDPDCPLCSEKGKEKLLALEQRLSSASIASIPQALVKPTPLENDSNKDRPLQTVALLLDDNTLEKAAAIIGTLKAGKTYVPLDPSLSGGEDRLCQILEQSEVRRIITCNEQREMAEKLRDKVHKGIPVINVSKIIKNASHLSEENPGIEVEPHAWAYTLFPPDSAEPEAVIMQSHQEVLHFSRLYSLHLQNNADTFRPIMALSAYDLKTPVVDLLVPLLTANPDRDGEVPLSFESGTRQEESADSLAQLREYLASELPDYMIPSYFVQLGKIPLTPNGKIDHKSLPDPEIGMPAGEHEGPRDEFEEKLVQAWSEILGIGKEKIGIGSNFFELGGNSLNLITLVSRIHKAFGVEISITQIFESPIIKEISKYVKANKFSEESVVLLNQLREKKIFCFPPQIAYGVFYLSLASLLDDYSLYAFSFIEEDDRLKRYIDLISNLQPAGPYILFGYSAAAWLTFEVTKALENHGYEVSDIIFLDCFYNEAPIALDEEFMREHYGFIDRFMETFELTFLKEKVLKKSLSYMEYCQKTTRLEKVNANVHLIFSEEAQNYERFTPNCWEELTTKASISYKGFGTHQEVFLPGALEKNVKIIRDILNRIETRK